MTSLRFQPRNPDRGARVLLALVPLAMIAPGCTSDRAPERDASRATAAPPARTTPPTTAATADEVRGMVLELASARACDLIRGRWSGMRDPTRPTVTGTLWIRGCDSSGEGDHRAFAISASGWQWLDVTRKLPSGTYVIRDYQRFDVRTTLSGRLEIGYDRASRTASLRFIVDELPRYQITPLPSPAPGQPVAAPPVDAAILGAVIGAFVGRRTPEPVDLSQGPRSIDIAATIPLCLGAWFLSVGTRPEVPEADAVRAPVELGPRGLAVYGPFRADQGVTVNLQTEEGAPRVSLVCEDDAAEIATAFLHDQPLPQPRPLATAVARGSSRLHVAWPRCPVVMIASSTEPRTERFSWFRPIDETRALQQPPVHCPSPPEPAIKPAP